MRSPICKAAAILVLMLATTSLKAQTFSTNPGEYMALQGGNELINSQVNSQISAQQKTAESQQAISAAFTHMHRWEDSYNRYLKSTEGFATALMAATHIWDDGMRIFISLGRIRQAVANNPQGVVATVEMNDLYMETLTELVGVYDCIEQAVKRGGKENMLTGSERSKTLWTLQDRLQSFSNKLHRLYLSLRHYNLTDMWNHATAGMIHRDNGTVALQSLDSWKRSAREASIY